MELLVLASDIAIVAHSAVEAQDHHIPYKGVKLPFVQPDDKIHCLGININPWKRKPKFDAGAKLLSVA